LKPRNAYPFFVTKKTKKNLQNLKNNKILFFDFKFKNHIAIDNNEFLIFPAAQHNVNHFL
jgi:hypothetical protein